MAPARSAIGRAIQAAIALTDTKGQPMTPSNVWANCRTAGLHMALTRAEVDAIVDGAVKHRIPIVLKRLGYLVGDDTTRERIEYGECSTLELAVQLDIQAESMEWDKARHKAMTRTAALLQRASKRAGRQVKAREERPAIVKIYAGEGLGPPPGL